MSTDQRANEEYTKMWDDYASKKAQGYSVYKFQPTHRIGLTNYLRERELINILELKPEDEVLDTGCASGRQVLEMSHLVHKCHGTDISAAFVNTANANAARTKIDNVAFSVASVEQLPFADGSFNKIVCAEVLEHVADKNIALQELLRVLSPNGRLAITVPNMNADATWWGRLSRMLGLRRFEPLKHFSASEIAKHGDAHVREFTAKNLTNWLHSYNLTVVRIESVSFIDGPWCDLLLKLPLHFSCCGSVIIWIEKLLTQTKLFWGRHLIVAVEKNNL